MERSTGGRLIEIAFDPERKLSCNRSVIDEITRVTRLRSHITVLEGHLAEPLPSTPPPPASERTFLTSDRRAASARLLQTVFPDQHQLLLLHSSNTPTAKAYFDPDTGLSTIMLDHQIIRQKAMISNPQNPDQPYIALLNNSTRQNLWRIIQAEKLQIAKDLLYEPLNQLRTLASSLAYNAVGCGLLYSSYELDRWTIGNPDLDLAWRVGLGSLALWAGITSLGLEGIIAFGTVDSIRNSYQTLRDYILYTSIGKEFLDNLSAAWAATRELCIKRPQLLGWE